MTREEDDVIFQRPETRDILTGLFAIAEYGDINQIDSTLTDWFESAIDALVELDTSQVGVAENVRGLAMLVASRLLTNDARKETIAGPLVAQVRTATWSGITDGPGDVSTIATAVRGLAAILPASSDEVRSGVATLAAMQSVVGTWLFAGSELSSVEATSLALLALYEAGEHRFVPFQVAEDALDRLGAQAQQDEVRLSTLEGDFDAEVERRYGALQEQADDIAREAELVRSQLSAAEQRAERQAQELSRLRSDYESRLERLELTSVAAADEARAEYMHVNGRVFGSPQRFVATLAVFGAALGIVTLIVGTVARISWVAVGAACASAIGLGILQYVVDRRRIRAIALLGERRGRSFATFASVGSGLDTEEFDIERLVAQFALFSSDWAGRTRREFVLQLQEALADMPPDMFRRFAARQLVELGAEVGRGDVAKVEFWLDQVSLLPSYSRRALYGELRRAL